MMNFKRKAILTENQTTTSSVLNTDLTQDKKAKKNKTKTQNNLPKKYLGNMSAFASLLTATGAILLISWLGYILILDPNSVLWINRFLPKNWQIPLAIQTAPQTLAEIKKQATTENLIVGDLISVGEDVLIPFYQTLKDCTENCQTIVEIKAYAPTYVVGQDLKYRFLDLITLGELNGTFTDQFKDFNEPLKLTNLQLLENSPHTGGNWFNLSGENEDKTLLYGQIFYYDPFQKNLSLILPWQSSAKKNPQWQKVTGANDPELLIDQSKLFTPLFQIYTLNINPEYNQFEEENDAKKPYVFLKEINLTKPALSLPEFEPIMKQIKAGLWSLALQNLNSLQKQINSSLWTETASQQKAAIAFHAQLSEKQCEQDQDRLENQITACLLNSNGTLALEYFEPILMAKKKRKIEHLLTWLKDDNLQIKNRLETIIKLNQFDEDLKIWQGLIMYSQSGQKTAIDWFKKQENNSTETITKFEDILNQIDLVFQENSYAVNHSSQIIATAIPVSNIELNQWQNPTTNNKINPIQSPEQWYIMTINSFYDGKEWNHFPFSYLNLQENPSILSLWKMLGLEVNSRMKIVIKKSQTKEEITLVNIKGIRIQNEQIELLAVGIPLDENQSIPAQPLPLAYSESALNPLELGKITLTDLSKIQPQLSQKMLPQLWQSLSAKFKENNKINVNNVEEILSKIGHWEVKTADVTGNDQPEGILTLYQDGNGNIDSNFSSQTKSGEINQRTVIFSDQGDLIYNELKDNAAEFLMTIANLQEGNSPILLIDNGEGQYIIKIWSSSQQKFIQFQ